MTGREREKVPRQSVRGTLDYGLPAKNLSPALCRADRDQFFRPQSSVTDATIPDAAEIDQAINRFYISVSFLPWQIYR
ncbi:hypothetical protein [Burkholderia territorii]|uniref:hypothetical protein n=1 Tax=Burkholderia territorii TaxID=1503055 RepID=UPI0012D8D140|nr:hypothetical protein [Burkholderia territorii]